MLLTKKTKILVIIFLLVLIIFLINIFFNNGSITGEVIYDTDFAGTDESPDRPWRGALIPLDKNYKFSFDFNKILFISQGKLEDSDTVKKNGIEYFFIDCKKDECGIFSKENKKDVSLASIYLPTSPIWLDVDKGYRIIIGLSYKGCSSDPYSGYVIALKDGSWYNMHRVFFPCSDEEFITSYFEFTIQDNIEAVSFQRDFIRNDKIMFRGVELKKS